MRNALRRWREARILARHPIPENEWQRARRLPALRHLDAQQLERLRRLATLFIHSRDWHGAHGLTVSNWKCTRIAAEACVPILYLGLDAYAHWRTIVLYATDFVAEREHVDDDTGVVHSIADTMAGGPVLLSWLAIERPEHPGFNVVIHEMAHTLDRGNGAPLLPADIDARDWQTSFAAAFERQSRHAAEASDTADDDGQAWLDAYATEAPEEFFAVASECFFMQPDHLLAAEPDVYRLLAAYYRQHPAATTRH